MESEAFIEGYFEVCPSSDDEASQRGDSVVGQGELEQRSDNTTSPAPSPASSPKRRHLPKISRKSHSCRGCRARKIRCNKELVCKNCRIRGTECIWDKGARPLSNVALTAAESEDLETIENLRASITYLGKRLHLDKGDVESLLGPMEVIRPLVVAPSLPAPPPQPSAEVYHDSTPTRWSSLPTPSPQAARSTPCFSSTQQLVASPSTMSEHDRGRARNDSLSSFSIGSPLSSLASGSSHSSDCGSSNGSSYCVANGAPAASSSLLSSSPKPIAGYYAPFIPSAIVPAYPRPLPRPQFHSRQHSDPTPSMSWKRNPHFPTGSSSGMP